jgi:RNA ligase
MKIDIDVLNRYAAEKKVKRQRHPSLPLIIWNYTEITQFKRLWDDVTLQCRALVTDDNGEVVARSFPKFFNENEAPYRLTDGWKVYEKVDGSLGLLFNFRGEWVFSSRGSFTSGQAAKGRAFLVDKYPTLMSLLDPSLAYTFEIIYPENRIVVDYGAEELLVFLAAFDRDGREHTDASRQVLFSAGVPVAREVHFPPGTSFRDLLTHDRNNEEGYVVKFSDGRRVKIKFPRYISLHRVMGNVTVDWVMECYIERQKALDNGDVDDSPAPAIEDTPVVGVPDELLPWVQDVWGKIADQQRALNGNFEEAYGNALAQSTLADGTFDRGVFARAALQGPWKSAMFARLDNRPYRTHLLRLIHSSSCAVAVQ